MFTKKAIVLTADSNNGTEIRWCKYDFKLFVLVLFVFALFNKKTYF